MKLTYQLSFPSFENYAGPQLREEHDIILHLLKFLDEHTVKYGI
jgi:hypothetical protein